MVFPDSVALYVKRCPGVSVNRYIGRLPNAQLVTPSAHIQIQLPKVDAMDTRSAQILCDVSTAASTGGPFVMPRYGAQTLIESSTLICGGRTIGGQSNQFYNIWNHIKQDYTAGVQDQPKMSVFGGAADVPPIGNASTASTAGTYDVNGTYTPPTLTSYNTSAWGMGSQTRALQPGQTNLLIKDGTTGWYTAGQPQIIEVFNETLESIQPELLPTIMMQNLYVDLGFAAPNMLIGPSTGTPSYQIQNIALQCTTYDLGQAFRDFHISYVNQGNVLEMPFKSVQAWPGPTNTGIDTQLNFTCGTQSLDMLVACFLDSGYRNWDVVQSDRKSVV